MWIKNICHALEFERVDRRYVAHLVWMDHDVLDPPATLLHPTEIERWNQFKSPSRRQQFCNGRYCAKRALSPYLPGVSMAAIEVTSGVFQQPILSGSTATGCGVSIAHSGTVSAAIVFPEGHPIGIDVQVINATKTAAIQSVLTDNDHQIVAHTPIESSSAHTLCWSARESLSKVLKTGMMVSQFIYEISQITRLNETWWDVRFAHFHQYRALIRVQPTMVMALCIPKHSAISVDALA